MECEQAFCFTILMKLMLLCPVAIVGNVMHQMIQITIEQGRIFLLCRWNQERLQRLQLVPNEPEA